MADHNIMTKHLPKLIMEDIKTQKVLYVPMLAKKFTLKESNQYDNDKLDFRPKYKEPIVKCTTGTCYSIDKTTFDEKMMVQIRFLSS